MRVQTLCREDPLEEGMATHSSILAWRIPRTEVQLHGFLISGESNEHSGPNKGEEE